MIFTFKILNPKISAMTLVIHSFNKYVSNVDYMLGSTQGLALGIWGLFQNNPAPALTPLRSSWVRLGSTSAQSPACPTPAGLSSSPGTTVPHPSAIQPRGLFWFLEDAVPNCPGPLHVLFPLPRTLFSLHFTPLNSWTWNLASDTTFLETSPSHVVEQCQCPPWNACF